MLHVPYNRSDEERQPPPRQRCRKMSLSPGHLVGPLGPAESQATDGHKGTMIRSSEQVAKPQRPQEKLSGVQHFLQLKVIEHLQLNLEKRIDLQEHSGTVVHNPFYFCSDLPLHF